MHKLFETILEILDLSKRSTPIHNFDVTYDGKYKSINVIASFKKFKQENDVGSKIEIVWKDGPNAVGFDSEKFDHEEKYSVNFDIYEIELDEHGHFEVDQTSIGDFVKYQGNVKGFIKRMFKKATKYLSELNEMSKKSVLRNVIREKIKKIVGEQEEDNIDLYSVVVKTEDRDFVYDILDENDLYPIYGDEEKNGEHVFVFDNERKRDQVVDLLIKKGLNIRDKGIEKVENNV